MSKDEAIEKLTDLTDRYPMDVGQDGMALGGGSADVPRASIVPPAC